MPLVADRVKETTTTAGTGTLTLAGAATGFQSFSAAFGTGAVVYYVIAAGADWEIGIGTTGSGTLSRDTVLQSSNGDALVDWPAGTKDVFCAYVADRAVTTSDPATLTNKTIDDYTNNVGANSTHFRIKAGATLAKGDVVKAVGFTPGEQAIEVVKVASSSDVALGICEQALNSGNFGLAVVIGELFNVNTNGFSVNQTLYSNGSGGFTSTKPSSGLYQVLGWVVRANASNGVIAVNVVSPLYVEASTNTVNTAVIRDASGNFAAGTITAALTGNATTATTATQVANALTAGSYLTSGGTFTGAAARTFAVDATDASTASKVVARDASGAASFDAVKLDGSSSGTVTLQGAATAGTWALTLPTSGGTNGQALTTDGNGGTSWSTVGGQTQQTQSGTYTLTSADVGKQIIHTGGSSLAAFYVPDSTGSALTNGQFIDVLNAGAQITIGSAATWDSTVLTSIGQVYDAVRYANGKVLIIGTFNINGNRQYIARFNADGTLDTSFERYTSFNGDITCVSLTNDESAIYIGGGFTTFTNAAGTTFSRNYAAKLNGSTGAVDTAWNNGGGLNSPYSIAQSGTTVAISSGYASSRIRFYSSTTGAYLGTGVWGYAGQPDTYAFYDVPYVKAHPTVANAFIALNSSGSAFFNENGEAAAVYSALLHFNQNTGPVFQYASQGNAYYDSGFIVTSNAIYAAVGSSNTYVYRWTIGTVNPVWSAGASPGGGAVARSVFVRASDNAVFMGTTGSTSTQSLWCFNGTTAASISLPTISAHNGYGLLGQVLSNGKVFVCNAIVNGTNTTAALTVTPLEGGAQIVYPPFQSGASQSPAFGSTQPQSLRFGQTMRIQKVNGALYVVQRNTPYQ